jgi:uncharacterized protein (TIGR02246 family)
MNDNLTLEQALQLWRDTEEVKNLKAEYCYLADGIPSLDVNKPRQVDCEQFANLFAEDAVFYTSAGEVVEGRDRIREHCRSFQAFPLALHIIATPQIKVDGDNAVGKWHGIVPLITAVDKVAALMVVRYEDNFVRTKDGWKIKSIKSERYFSSPLDQGWAKVRFMAAERRD